MPDRSDHNHAIGQPRHATERSSDRMPGGDRPERGVDIPSSADHHRQAEILVLPVAAVLVTSATRLHQGAVLIRVEGELDLATSPKLRAAVLAEITTVEPPTEVRLDLSGISFIDAVGIGTLVHCRETARRLAVGFSVRNPHGLTRRLLEIFQLTEALRVHAPAPDRPAHRTGEGRPGTDPADEISRCG